MRPPGGKAMLVRTALLLLVVVSIEAQEAILQVRVTDATTGRVIPCTLTLQDAHGKIAMDTESFRSGLRCSGEFTRRLPAGRVRLRVSHGPEWQTIQQDLELQPGEKREVAVSLRRVTDLRRRGWYAGDSHVHMIHGERTIPVDFDFVALSAQAEDLQYLSLAQAWTLERPTPESLAVELARRSTPDCTLSWNLEAPKNYYLGDARRCLGHCWTLAMRGRTPDGDDVIQELMAASAWDYESAKPSFANFESHRLIRAQGGMVAYSHPARWWLGSWGGAGGYPKMEQTRVSNLAVELPLDVLIGPTFDGLDIITTGGEYAANARAFELWALLLNHGYRLAATASSDACFDRPGGGVPGVARTYAYLEAGFSLSSVARAIAKGMTFVTTGPLLLAAIDGEPPGSSFTANGRERLLRLEAWAGGHQEGGLSRLEILRNGTTFRQLLLEDHPAACQTNVPLRETESAWYCARLFGADPQKERAISGAFFFDAKPFRPPEPVPAIVQARILDARTGAPLAGTLTEFAYFGTKAREGKRHKLGSGGGRLSVPATVRLRADATGYAPITLSPFFDQPQLLDLITHLQEPDLVDWKTYEQVRALLAHVSLTFRLTPKGVSSYY